VQADISEEELRKLGLFKDTVSFRRVDLVATLNEYLEEGHLRANGFHFLVRTDFHLRLVTTALAEDGHLQGEEDFNLDLAAVE